MTKNGEANKRKQKQTKDKAKTNILEQYVVFKNTVRQTRAHEDARA